MRLTIHYPCRYDVTLARKRNVETIFVRRTLDVEIPDLVDGDAFLAVHDRILGDKEDLFGVEGMAGIFAKKTLPHGPVLGETDPANEVSGFFDETKQIFHGQVFADATGDPLPGWSDDVNRITIKTHDAMPEVRRVERDYADIIEKRLRELAGHCLAMPDGVILTPGREPILRIDSYDGGPTPVLTRVGRSKVEPVSIGLRLDEALGEKGRALAAAMHPRQQQNFREICERFEIHRPDVLRQDQLRSALLNEGYRVMSIHLRPLGQMPLSALLAYGELRNATTVFAGDPTADMPAYAEKVRQAMHVMAPLRQTSEAVVAEIDAVLSDPRLQATLDDEFSLALGL